MTTVRFQGRSLEVLPGHSVLDTFEAAGITLPSACRTGVCQTCRVRLVAGTIPETARAGLGQARRERGDFLACVCHPTEDIEVEPVDAAATVPATIEAITTRGDVLYVTLAPARPVGHEAGQFVALIRDDGLARPYSLASLPGAPKLVLHVQHFPGGQMSGWLATHPVGANVTLQGPSGECFYLADPPETPLLLVGSGTGLAPLWAIASEALRRGHHGPITLIHAAKTLQGLYARAELAALANEHANLRVVLTVPAEVHDGDAGVVTTAVETLALAHANASDRTKLRAYLCGSPPLVHKLRRQLFLAGMPMRSILADAFLPAAPRPESRET